MAECQYLRGACPVGCERTEEIMRGCWMYYSADRDKWREVAGELATAIRGVFPGWCAHNVRRGVGECEDCNMVCDVKDALAENDALRGQGRG